MKKQRYFPQLLATIGFLLLQGKLYAEGDLNGNQALPITHSSPYCAPIPHVLMWVALLLVAIVALCVCKRLSRKKVVTLVVIVLVFSGGALYLHKSKRMDDVATRAIGHYATQYFSKHPAKLLSLLQQVQQTLSDEQFAAVKRTLIAHRQFLLNANALPSMGKEHAPLTLLFFFDFQCAYCHKQSPILQTLIHDQRNVKLVFVPLALFGHASAYANKVALYAKKQGKFTDFYRALENADLIEGRLSVAGVNKIARSVGLSPSLANAAITRGDFTHVFLQVNNLQQALGISGTPFLFLMPSDADKLNLHTIRILRGFTSSTRLHKAISVVRERIREESQHA